MINARSVLTAWRSQLVDKDMPRALDQVLTGLARQVEANAPVRSGELAGAVEKTPIQITPKRISGAVIVDSDHALAVEYGTDEMGPEPFFHPAIRSERPRMIATVEELTK